MNKSYGEESFSQTIWHFLPGILKFLSVLGIGLVIFNLVSINLSSSINDNLEQTTKTSLPLIRSYNPVLGKADADLKLVYFIDYQCPVCGSNKENMTELKSQYKDRISFIYKHYPIVTAHVYAEAAARAVEAAAKQNKAYELGDLLLSRQSDGFSPTNFANWAGEIGINVDKFNTDRGSNEIKREVEIDQSDYDNAIFPVSTISGQAKTSGQTGGTPTTVLIKGGKIIDWWSGKADISEVKSKLDEYLK